MSITRHSTSAKASLAFLARASMFRSPSPAVVRTTLCLRAKIGRDRRDRRRTAALHALDPWRRSSATRRKRVARHAALLPADLARLGTITGEPFTATLATIYFILGDRVLPIPARSADGRVTWIAAVVVMRPSGSSAQADGAHSEAESSTHLRMRDRNMTTAVWRMSHCMIAVGIAASPFQSIELLVDQLYCLYFLFLKSPVC